LVSLIGEFFIEPFVEPASKAGEGARRADEVKTPDQKEITYS
jgi:hypothetical protein